MNPYSSRARRILLTAAASLLLTGCSAVDSLFGPSDQPGLESLFGSSDQLSEGHGASDQPVAIDQGTIEQGRLTLSPDEGQVGVFSTTESGNLAVTVDWGSVENSIVLELYQGTCTAADILEDRLTGTCSDATLVAIADEIPVVKPNVLTAPNLAPGTYTLLIEYFGQPGQPSETVTFSVILSPLS